MASLPTGSNKILEVQSGNIHVVIKAKNLHPNLINESISKQSSALRITGFDVSSVKVLGEEKIAEGSGAIGMSSHNIHTAPVFFEQTDYEIIIKSMTPVYDENSGVVEKIETNQNEEIILFFKRYGTT